MHTYELVPGDPYYKGRLDASGEGAGGIWISGARDMTSIVWHVPWPAEIRMWLVTFEKPTSDITKSNLEMAAEVFSWLVCVGVCSDNSVTVSW